MRGPMPILVLPFSPRYFTYTLTCLTTLVLLALAIYQPAWLGHLAIPLALFGGLSALGTRDLLQTKHAILRNYPISAHLRFIFEEIRPELRQYFFEGDTDGTPFSREKRALVYQRAKHVLDKRPFGTQYEVY